MDTAMKAREFVEKVISAPFAKDGVKEDVMPAVWIGELIQVCRTGDVLLTSNKDFGAKLIQKTTRTRWNHVGIITRPSPTHAYLVEWAGGIIVADLETRLHEYAKHGSVDVCIRHLLVKGPHATRTAIEERLEAFVFMLADKNFGTNTKISMRVRLLSSPLLSSPLLLLISSHLIPSHLISRLIPSHIRQVMLKNFRGQNLAEASHSPSREVYEDDLTEARARHSNCHATLCCRRRCCCCNRAVPPLTPVWDSHSPALLLQDGRCRVQGCRAARRRPQGSHVCTQALLVAVRVTSRDLTGMVPKHVSSSDTTP
jgi:hypothetical protein